jgi:RNA polymerase sigma-70 factor, ECF subfamily
MRRDCLLRKEACVSHIGLGQDTEALITRCNRGEQRAWEEFYATYHGMISAAVRRLPGPVGEDTEDIVQEVFLHLFKALRNYDPLRPLEAYILEIARRVKISRLRVGAAAKRGGLNPGHRRVDAHDGEEEGAGTVHVRYQGADQEQLLMEAEESRLLRRALRAVSEHCRQLLAYRFERGLSYKEIAETLDEKEGTLRVRLQRCLSSLARHFAEIGSEEGGRR